MASIIAVVLLTGNEKVEVFYKDKSLGNDTEVRTTHKV